MDVPQGNPRESATISTRHDSFSVAQTNTAAVAAPVAVTALHTPVDCTHTVDYMKEHANSTHRNRNAQSESKIHAPIAWHSIHWKVSVACKEGRGRGQHCKGKGRGKRCIAYSEK